MRDGGAEDDEEVLDCGPHLEDDEAPCLWEVSWGGCGLRGREGGRVTQVMSLRAPSPLIR